MKKVDKAKKPTRPRRVGLDEIVSTVASHYSFSVNWDDELHKWIIKDSGFGDCAFYWSSEESISVFFDSLKEYFKDKGAENARC